jgi:hypothetical protein
MAPPPALATAPAPIPTLVERAVGDILAALENSHGDRVVLESNQIPMLMVGTRSCALMAGRLSAKAVQRITEHLLPAEYLEALEEIGATRYHGRGFVAHAAYEGDSLSIEIARIRH